MKRILGLDLGTTSIGWAFVNEAENENETSSIVRSGVRVVPLSTDEIQNFSKIDAETAAGARTTKRSMRRNLQRYKQRRSAVLKLLKEKGFLKENEAIAENFPNSTHHTLKVRALAPTQKISRLDFARVMLAINKKRGYKSSRKANNQEEGELVDGMKVAKRLNDENITPGQLTYQILVSGKKYIPVFYRSDLKEELMRIWQQQQQYYPNVLTQNHFDKLDGLNQSATKSYLKKEMNIERAEPKGNRDEKKLQSYLWRNQAIVNELNIEEIAYVIAEINNQIFQSSGYLGAISDRSKELFFNNLTVGQFQYNLIKKDSHYSLKNQVFYRQDYQDEFDAIWEQQSQHYKELNNELRKELRDISIFYQRRLKSQKNLINLCEFESHTITVNINGESKTKEIGSRVAPRSSPIFQIFKVLSNINAIRVQKKDASKQEYKLHDDDRLELFKEINWIDSMSDSDFLKWLFKGTKEQPDDYEIKYGKLEGNRTNAVLLKSFIKIAIQSGHNKINYKKAKSELITDLKSCFEAMGIDSGVLELNLKANMQDVTMQPAYQLWHLLYSYEDDNSVTGTESLIKALSKFGFKEEHMPFLINISFKDDYGSLSTKAMHKIIPYLKEGLVYSEAAATAGYNHSNSITADQNKDRTLHDKLDILKKNTLRNPVVEKILNQMVNVVNAILEDEKLGRPDEIRVELARDLKQTVEQRNEEAKYIKRVTTLHEEYREKIKREYGLTYVSKKDLIKYKLYLELKSIGYRTLYSGTYIEPSELFTRKFDVEHIIPQSVRFDDSFSNKTLELRHINEEKGNQTAIDYCDRKGWKEQFERRVENVYKDKEGISGSKKNKLQLTKDQLSDKPITRHLNNTGYITKEALKILFKIVRTAPIATNGSITDKLRSDWELIDVLKELNWSKYEKMGLTYYDENKEGKKLPRIKDWSKRNDHRHHAMDAIAVAFTRPAFINYLNNKHAKSRGNEIIDNIEKKFTYRDKIGGRKFKKPFEDIRAASKSSLSDILISFKAKNKVTSRNNNYTKKKAGRNIQETLTPRGQLHEQTIYGSSLSRLTKLETVNSSFDEYKIKTITSKEIRELLLLRLQSNRNDPKKAFTGKNSLSKLPLVLEDGTEITSKVEIAWFDTIYTIRKPIDPDLNVDKVIDEKVKSVLKKRITDFDGNKKLAFSNLYENPIWLNKEQGIKIKRATIKAVSNAIPLHEAKDVLGNDIVDDRGNKQPNSFVSQGNNYAIALYEDEKGKLNEQVLSFFDAVTRQINKLPVVEHFNELGHKLKFTLKQNEMFLIPTKDFDPRTFNLSDPSNNSILSENLFRVQKITSKDYVFRHHLETTLNNSKDVKGLLYHRVNSTPFLENIIKVRIDHLGRIVHEGEY
jgi:CRISPR-associated endonuclease Csn1